MGKRIRSRSAGLMKHSGVTGKYIGESDIESVTEWLNLGSRTVQRRLKVEGWTFRELRQASLQDRANELLIESDATITEIAVALGYTSKQHFIRAYQNWAGVTPGRFRKKPGVERAKVLAQALNCHQTPEHPTPF